MPYKWMSKEETARVAEAIKEQVKIEDYAVSLGYHIVKKGKYLSLNEMDSIRIDTSKNCFYRNSGIGNVTSGSIFDFAMNINGYSFHEAFLELQKYINVEQHMDYPDFSPAPKTKKPEIETAEKKALRLPEKAQNMRRVYAYLLKSRHLELDVVQDFVDRDMLYQDARNNCCFVGYDESGEPNYGFLRGTNTNKRFVGDVPGCDYEKGFYIHNGSDKLIVSESIIDAASVMSVLHAQGYDFKDYDYYALAGASKLEGIFSRIKDDSYKEILMAPDNDKAGKISVQKMEDFLKENPVSADFSVHYPTGKDWNQDLVDVRSRFADINSLHFFQPEKINLGVEEMKEPEIFISSYCRVDNITHAVGKMNGELFSCPVWRKGNDLYLKFKNGHQHNLTVQEQFKLKKFSQNWQQSYKQQLEQQYQFQKKDDGIDI